MRNHKQLNCLPIAAIIFGAFCQITRADWKEPADKIIPEDRFKVFLATESDWLTQVGKIQDDEANAKTDAGRLAAVMDISKKYQACLDNHKISDAELNWIASNALAAYGVEKYAKDVLAKSEDEIQKNFKDCDDKIADAQVRLTAYQTAQKNGTRVLTVDQKNAATQQSADDQKAALDEAKQHEDEAKAADAEAKQNDDEAKAADALAANPPADVSADDKQSYIDGKKSDAQSARDSAKESRDRAADARKAEADAMAVANAAANKGAHPEVPVTDDEKAQVKADNEAGITQAQNDLDQAKSMKVSLAQTDAQLTKSAADIGKDVPQANLDLLKKYEKDYEDMLQGLSKSGTLAKPG